EDVPALAALDGRGVLLVVEVGVGAGEVDGAGDEHLPAGTGAGRVVGGEAVGPAVVPPGEPGRHGDLLGGSARPGGRAPVAAARGEREQRRGGRDPPSVPARCHPVPCRLGWVAGGWPTGKRQVTGSGPPSASRACTPDPAPSAASAAGRAPA